MKFKRIITAAILALSFSTAPIVSMPDKQISTAYAADIKYIEDYLTEDGFFCEMYGTYDLEWGENDEIVGYIPTNIKYSYAKIKGYRGTEAIITIPAKVKGVPVKNVNLSQCDTIVYVDFDSDSTLSSLDDNAFSDCKNLQSIELPQSLKIIGQEAFANCSKLSAIDIPDSVVSIGSYAFSGCSSIKTITLPPKLTTLEDGTLSGCSTLLSVTFNNKLTSIGVNTFADCGNLLSVDIPDSVLTIGENAFEDCSALNSVKLPKNLSAIKDYLFWGCTHLVSIDIPENVISIGRNAFDSCESLREIQLPENLNSLGNYVFTECGSLTSVVIPNNITTIPEWAFAHCTSLKSVIIPDSVTTIKALAFYGTGLDSVEIPSSVKSIEREAFNYVSTIYGHKGTEAETYAHNYGIDFVDLDAPVTGDCNEDGEFSVADVILLQKWILADKDTTLKNWKVADICEDNVLDVFDLIGMKQLLIKK